MQVIGLTGVAGAGKSTVANYLVEQHGFTRLSFAAPLKKMLRTLNPIIGNPPSWAGHNQFKPYFYLNDLFEAVEKNLELLELPTSLAEQDIKDGSWGPEYRRLLQVLGTDCIRAVDEDFWVKAAIKQMTDEDGKYVFDDVRFPNEAEVIKGLNYWGLWNVWRPGFEAVNGHASEQHAGKMDEVIQVCNNSDLGALSAEVDTLLDLAVTSVVPV